MDRSRCVCEIMSVRSRGHLGMNVCVCVCVSMSYGPVPPCRSLSLPMCVCACLCVCVCVYLCEQPRTIRSSTSMDQAWRQSLNTDEGE